MHDFDWGGASCVFGKPCLCSLPKRGHFDENGENDKFAFYPLKARASLLRPSKMTKMAGVTQAQAWFRKGRVCSSLICCTQLATPNSLFLRETFCESGEGVRLPKKSEQKISPKRKFLGRTSRGHPGVIRADIPAQNFGQGGQNPGKNKHFGADIHDPKARTSSALRGFQKLGSGKLWAEFSFPKKRGCPPGKSRELPGKSRELPGKSGKLPGNL